MTQRGYILTGGAMRALCANFSDGMSSFCWLLLG